MIMSLSLLEQEPVCVGGGRGASEECCPQQGEGKQAIERRQDLSPEETESPVHLEWKPALPSFNTSHQGPATSPGPAFTEPAPLRPPQHQGTKKEA